VVESEGLQGVQSCQTDCRENSHGLGLSTYDIVDVGRNSIQIDEQEEETYRQGGRTGYGFHASGGCVTGCHVVLLKGYFLPQRENRGPFGGAHQGFGQNGGFTGEWRSRGGEWRDELDYRPQ
jgi:hypothetical protein